jgi:hypothetical protein
MCAMKKLLFPILAAFLLAGSQALAEESKTEEPAVKADANDNGLSLIQMRSIMVPFIKESGKKGNTPVTVFIEVDNDRDVGTFCSWGPKVRDAIFGAFMRYPPKVIKRKMQLALLTPRMKKRLNKVFKKELVKGVLVLEGTRKVGMTGSASKLPGTSIGCQRIFDKSSVKGYKSTIKQ